MYVRMLRGLGDWFDDIPSPTSSPMPSPNTDDDLFIHDVSAASENTDAPLTLSSSGDWVSTGGICKPTSEAFLSIAKRLQQQMNRVADVKNFPKIAVDGVIGPLSRGLLDKIAAIAPSGSLTQNLAGASCDVINSRSLDLTADVGAIADALGASASVASPAPSRTPSTINPATKQIVPQGIVASLGDKWGRLSGNQKLAVGALAVVGAVVGYHELQRKGVIGGKH